MAKRTSRSWLHLNLPRLVLPVAIFFGAKAMSHYQDKGFLAFIPDWSYDVALFLAAIGVLYWVWTQDDVRKGCLWLYNRRPKVLLMILIIVGAILGGVTGVFGYWSIERQNKNKDARQEEIERAQLDKLSNDKLRERALYIATKLRKRLADYDAENSALGQAEFQETVRLKETSRDKVVSEEDQKRLFNEHIQKSQALARRLAFDYEDQYKTDSLALIQELLVRDPPGSRREKAAFFSAFAPANQVSIRSVADELDRLAKLLPESKKE
jgi:nitrogen fixation-related uncharacterized protein